MSDNPRKPHISLSGKRYKKIPFGFRKREEEKEEEEREVIVETSDVAKLQEGTKIAYANKMNIENKYKIKIEDDLYFILVLFNRVYTKKTFDRLQKIPIKINEIIDEYTIKVKLNRDKYEDFYYSLTELNDLIKNVKKIEINDKITKELLEELKLNEDEEGIYTIELFDINKLDTKNKIEQKLNNHLDNIKSNYKKIFESEYDVIYQIKLKNKDLIEITEVMDSITRVEKEPQTYLNNGSEELNFLDTKLLISEPDLDLPIICIIDSGINRDHNKLTNVIYDTYDLQTNNTVPCNDNIPHGSCVAGLAAYGGNPQTTTNPTASIIMIKNYIDKKTRITDNISAIQTAIHLYSNQFNILNLSFGSNQPNLSYSKALDKISFTNNLITVVSAGNIPPEKIIECLERGMKYPEYIKRYPIFFPGDCRNVITVGGCTHISTNLTPDNAPSPFTTANSFKSLVKPDVTEKAGNLGYSGNPNRLMTQGYGILVPSNHDSSYIERQGTSFSAPIVANIVARIINSFKDVQNPALIKALLLSSCSQLYTTGNLPYDFDIQGFGKPDLESVLYSNFWKCNYLIEGKFSARNPWHRDRYKFWFPAGADKLEVTLVCEKSETIYSTEKEDYIRFSVFDRAGTGEENTYLDTVLGEYKCFNTYKGEYLVERGSKGLWQIEIIPMFSTRYYVDMIIRYGCIISVKDTNKQNNIWDNIYEHWLKEILDEQFIKEGEESIGGLEPQIIKVNE